MPPINRIFIRPLQYLAIVLAHILRSPAKRLRLALKTRINYTHKSLANVIEAVGGVMGDFFDEVESAVAALEMIDEVELQERKREGVSA
jgi:hypothetical protein